MFESVFYETGGEHILSEYFPENAFKIESLNNEKINNNELYYDPDTEYFFTKTKSAKYNQIWPYEAITSSCANINGKSVSVRKLRNYIAKNLFKKFN